tara:strand:- start:1105 stop:1998 length:894 start_codon:yes stop_codon:yes gene_type:complete
MSISRQNLSVVIVTFKSNQVIDDCIRSIPEDLKITVVDNSNDKEFKEILENNYNNVTCILSPKNLGMGSGNNLGLRNVKTDYALILNPDVILEKDTISEILEVSKSIENFSIISPMSIDQKYPNYQTFKNKIESNYRNSFFKVKSVDGFAMILNLKKLNKFKTFENNEYFDENFFMYLENDDLCKRITELNENIYIVNTAKIKHLGAKAVDSKYEYEIELSRNWHWMWSKFYFNKKHYGFFFAFLNGFPTFLTSLLKSFIYLISNDKKKRNYFLFRSLGFMNALIGKKSYHRPKIDN